MLFQFRVHEMGMQQSYWPDQMTPADIGARARFIVTNVFERYPSWPSLADLSLDALLVAIGTGLVLIRAFREVVGQRAPGPFSLWLCWGGAIYTGTTFGMGMDWWQYYVPLVTVNVLVQALAVGSALAWLGARAICLVRRQARRLSFAHLSGREADIPESA